MPITVEDIKDHKEHFGLKDLDVMSIEEYHHALLNGAFLWMDHHDFVRSTFSGEILATNVKQLDLIIKHLQGFRMKILAC